MLGEADVISRAPMRAQLVAMPGVIFVTNSIAELSL